ncbi:MAG: heme ABC exporter ATP-binding protein CcmA [Capsulimonadales bacterium]|nr:heme ABC exporter ATP-binding protein CcmA [Capsulimonadales bacterium]
MNLKDQTATKVTKVRADNLYKAFGRRPVLENFGLTADAGEVVAIVGGNGSGKSTLLRIVAGLLRPTRGRIVLESDGVRATETIGRRRLVGYVSPDLRFYPELTARENLAFFRSVAGRPPRTEETTAVLARVGLAKRGEEPVGTFSSGMMQRLRLAFALLSGTSVLLLDEPTLALDADGVRLVREIVFERRQEGGIVLLASNDPREIEWADRQVPVKATGPSAETGETGGTANGLDP